MNKVENRVVILVHGYNVTNPEKTVGKLREPFQELGYTVESLNYRYLPHVWQVTKRNPSIAKKLAKRVMHWQSRGYLVDIAAHSNGVAIVRIADTDYGMACNTVVAISPALKKDLHPSPKANLVHVWHNKGDKAVVLGKWLRWLTPWAELARPWGEQGNKGYTGYDKDVVNYNASRRFKIKADGHSAYFHKPAREFYTMAMPLFGYEERTR